MKRKALMAVIVGVIMMLIMVVSSCDLFETKGKIYVRNASTYTVDATISVSIRQQGGSFSTPYILSRNNTVYWELDPGNYDIRVIDGAGTSYIYPSSTWITLIAGQERRFRFTGNSITTD